MITILSPTKSLNFTEKLEVEKFSQPVFQKESQEIMNTCKQLSENEIKKLMNISNKLLETTYARIHSWQNSFDSQNSRQAMLSYSGEVFNGLQAQTLSIKDLEFAQNHVRILSGLHGILHPLDLIQPYRLEMQTKLEIGKYKNLYQFWGDKILNSINEELENHKTKVLINLASNEYSKAVNLKKIKGKIITPVFKELKGNELKLITIYAKKARGLMTRFIIENRIDNPEYLKAFDTEGYLFSENYSNEKEWVFVR